MSIKAAREVVKDIEEIKKLMRKVAETHVTLDKTDKIFLATITDKHQKALIKTTVALIDPAKKEKKKGWFKRAVGCAA